jgi:N4-gp56 family major capsid protein
MADIITDVSAVEATRQAVIAQLVQRELKAQAIVAGTVYDVSQFAEPGAKSIDFPKATSFNVEKKISGSPANAQALTYSADKLELDQHAVIQWVIEKRASLQSRVNLELAAIQRATSAHARGIDSELIAALDASPGNTVTLSGSFGREEITEARRKLRQAFYPIEEGNVFLLIGPVFEEAMLNVADFIDTSKYGSNVPIMNGEIGKVFGLRVIVSELITASKAWVYHREALALGFQQLPVFEEQMDLAQLGMRQSLDQLYGIKVMQSGAGIIEIA